MLQDQFIIKLAFSTNMSHAHIGDLVICVDYAKRDVNGGKRTFIGLVLDKSITVYRIQILDTGQEIYWPMTATYLWKEK